MATVEDLLSVPEEQRAELIDGELIGGTQETPQHDHAQRSLGAILGLSDRKARREGSDSSGWWIITAAGVRYNSRTACRHDLAGWERGRMPALSDEEYVSITPDWVCEIVSPASRKHDLVRKKAAFQRARVPHYWTVDLADKAIPVHRWAEAGYINVANYEAGERAKLEPFDVVEIDVADILGD